MVAVPGILEGRVAIVTGAGRGIGRGLALKLAAEGAAVVVNGVTPSQVEETADLIAKEGGSATPIVADISVESEVEALVEAVYGHSGRVDILVNNAGINRDALFDQMTETQWDEVISVNLKGPWLCSKHVAPHMRRGGYGRIINIGAEGATVGNIGMCNYVASKMGLMGLTMTIAREMARWVARENADTTCNLVMPGYNETRMTDGIPAKVKDKFISDIPYGRPADPREDVGSVVAFLASPAGRHITGAKFSAGGGLMMNVAT